MKDKRLVIFLLAFVFTHSSYASEFHLFEDPLNTKIEANDCVPPGSLTHVQCDEKSSYSGKLSIGKAVDLALCNNPKIRAAWLNIKIQSNLTGEAKATYLPTINGSISAINDRLQYNDSKYKDTINEKGTVQTSLNWRLFDFGGRAAGLEASRSMLSAALFNHNATVQAIAAKVIQEYFDVVTSQAVQNSKIEAETISDSIFISAISRQAKGAVSNSDVLQAKTAFAKSSIEKNRADADYKKALGSLVNDLGVTINSDILIEDLHEEIPIDKRFLSKNLELWLEDAQKNHPAIQEAKKQVEAAKWRLDATRSAGLPTLNFSSNYYRNTRPGEAVTPTDAQETTVGIMASIPIFDGFATTYKIRGAQAQVEQKEAALNDTEHQIALEIIKAYADTESSLINLDVSSKLIESAKESLSVSKRKYDKGAADIIELLNAQSAFSDAKKERIRCLSDWHSSRLRLFAYSGQLNMTQLAN